MHSTIRKLVGVCFIFMTSQTLAATSADFVARRGDIVLVQCHRSDNGISDNDQLFEVDEVVMNQTGFVIMGYQLGVYSKGLGFETWGGGAFYPAAKSCDEQSIELARKSSDITAVICNQVVIQPSVRAASSAIGLLTPPIDA